MKYPIFRNGLLIANVEPDNSSQLSQKKETEDIVRLNFTLVNFTDFKVGDYIVVIKTNQKYYLNKPPKVTEAPKENKYECIFEGGIHEFNKTRVFLETPKEGGGSYIDYKFPLTGNAETFLTFIVNALNRNGGNYTAGIFKETPVLTIDFNNWTVSQALYELGVKLGFNWYLEGTELNFDNKTTVIPYTFQVGRGLGLLNISRTFIESEDIATVVYGYGSTQNMPPRTAETGQTYDSELLTENRLSFSGVDGESKLEKNIALYGRRESVQEFDEIKPEFTGEVSSISLTDKRIFYDTSIDFDINAQLASGLTPKITFLTGKLIGLTFNISYELTGDKIIMDYYSDESGQYPNELIFAEIGDTYKLFDIIMPQLYIDNAATELEEATQVFLDENSSPKVIYTAPFDPSYIEKENITLNLGDIVRIVSTKFNLDALYEIKDLVQSITQPFKYSIKFGDSLPKGLLANLKITNFTTEQSIYNVTKNSVSNNQVTNIVGDETSWETW